MSLPVNDPTLAAKTRAERQASAASGRDEVWDGVYVVPPLANVDHQAIVSLLLRAFLSVIDIGGGELALAGVTVSDRLEDWAENFRIPDIAVILAGSSARNCGTHLVGGPDFVVEVLSPNDRAREKLAFYAGVGVRELLVIDRDPWALELYRLDQGDLRPVGRSTTDKPDLLLSTVLPLVFRLVRGKDRPRIEARRSDGKQTWTA